MNKKFSKGEAIKFGWEGMKKNFWLFAGVLFLLLILSSISSSGNANAKTLSLWGAVISLLVAAIDTIIQMGIIRATLKVVGGEKPKIDDIFAERKLFWRYLGATILYGLIVVGGLTLFIIPGIIWSLKYQFARYLIICLLYTSPRLDAESVLGFFYLSLLVRTLARTPYPIRSCPKETNENIRGHPRLFL